VRNSSLVEWSGADNVTGLSRAPKLRILLLKSGRGAFYAAMKVDREDGWSA
jgi:hypothetical protein